MALANEFFNSKTRRIHGIDRLISSIDQLINAINRLNHYLLIIRIHLVIGGINQLIDDCAPGPTATN